MNSKIKLEENTGITLIALVVTIIVLLILAGVSISMLTGQNGILNRAAEAKEKTAEAQKQENNTLTEYEKTFNKYMSNLPSTEYTTPYLPDTNKFERVDGTDLSTGLVIREKATGSEYVWVEVPKTSEVYKNAGLDISTFGESEYNLIEKDLQDYTSEYRTQTNFKDEFFEDSSEGWFKNANEYNEAKYKMLKSVYENGGFWVGRYEAGVEENIVISGNRNLMPISMGDIYPYNFITRTQAKNLAEKIESGNYISSLIYGLQWDLMVKYIETKGNVSIDKLNSDSTTVGNYINSEFELKRGKFAQELAFENWYNFDSEEKKMLVTGRKKITQSVASNGILLTTGATEATNLQNIYDIAGNVWEWTLERNSEDKNQLCVRRGGSFVNMGSYNYISCRNLSSITDNSANIGFRVTIY